VGQSLVAIDTPALLFDLDVLEANSAITAALWAGKPERLRPRATCTRAQLSRLCSAKPALWAFSEPELPRPCNILRLAQALSGSAGRLGIRPGHALQARFNTQLGKDMS